MARAKLPLIPCLAVVLVCSGCVLPDQVTKLQKDVTDLHAELQRIQSEQAESKDRLDQLAAAVASPAREPGMDRSAFADLKLSLDEISRQQSILDERLVESNRRLDRLSQSVQENRELVRRIAVAPGTGEVVPPPPSDTSAIPAEGPGETRGAPGALPSADDLYHSAYADFSKGNYALAISGFEEYAERYPDSDRADNALYWIGECYFSQGNYAVAVGAFDRMLERYPDSDRAAAANLKKGLAYLNQNQVRQAVVQLRWVAEQHPDTDEARVAREKLASLGVSSP